MMFDQDVHLAGEDGDSDQWVRMMEDATMKLEAELGAEGMVRWYGAVSEDATAREIYQLAMTSLEVIHKANVAHTARV